MNEANARLSHTLVTIRADLPLDRHWDELEREPLRAHELASLMTELEFHVLKRRFAAELGEGPAAENGSASGDAGGQAAPSEEGAESPPTDLFPETLPSASPAPRA